DFSLAALNPLKGAVLSHENILLKTGNALAKSGELKLKLKNKEIQLNPVLEQVFHLSKLEHSALTATSVRIPEPCTGVLHINIEFLKKPSLALPAEMKAANRFGSSATTWQLQGKSLTVRQQFQLSPFNVEAKGSDKVNSLLIPVLTMSNSIAFVQ
ncbi:MAG: hypothetical protein GXO70_06970, partial [Acidobacteria bacterium]|nr:hypothetical protein [Acidobacteriota bacterium]